MTKISYFFDPEIAFSRKNPILRYTRQSHHRIFEAFDKAVRIQLSLAEDLLNLNRKRFDTLYAGDGLMDKISAHQDLATELGKRTARWAGDMQETAFDLGCGFRDAANELLPGATVNSPSRKSGRKGARSEN